MVGTHQRSLGPHYPARRNAAVFLASGADTLVVDGTIAADLARLTNCLPYPITVVLTRMRCAGRAAGTATS